MKKKLDINVQIKPAPGALNNPKLADKYIVQITYVQGGAIFTDNKGGNGYSLHEAQELAFTMRDNIVKN